MMYGWSKNVLFDSSGGGGGGMWSLPFQPMNTLKSRQKAEYVETAFSKGFLEWKSLYIVLHFNTISLYGSILQ